MCLWSDVDVDEALAIRMGDKFPHLLTREWNDGFSHKKTKTQPPLSWTVVTIGNILVESF